MIAIAGQEFSTYKLAKLSARSMKYTYDILND